VKKLDRKD